MKVVSLRYMLWLSMACMPWTARAGAQAVPAQPPAIATTTAQQLAAAIDARIGQPRFASASWGISVVSLDDGRTVYAHDADRLMQPASTAKLYTAALVLDTLGSDYRIPTRLLGTGNVRHGKLDGSLILRGMGDPTLGTAGANSDWADQLAAQLESDGVREVSGDLIADDSYFAGPSIGSGWEAGDLQSWFAVPASALSVQENVVDVTVTPAARPGTPAKLRFDPPEALPRVVNRLATGARHARSDINLYRAPGDATLYAFGTIPARSDPQTFRLSVTDPALLAGTLLRDALTRHGIRVDGDLRVLHWPEQPVLEGDSATLLGQVLSPPLLEVLTRGLKRSQNLYLQNLLQIAGVKAQASAVQAGDPVNGFLSTEAWAIRALHELLDRIGIPPSASRLEEGTGLSRQDLTTPDAMVHLLAYLSRQPYATQLLDALPTAGVDGTLEWRMRDGPATDNVHAKTGSMNYVHCLAGYVTTATGERLAFAIMLNNYVRDADDPGANRDIDAIVEQLAAFRGRP